MNREDLVAYLDGELSLQEQDRVEQDLLADPGALGLFRDFCRQRVMLAELLATPIALPRRARRFHWQIWAAILLFTASVTAVWMRPETAPRLVQGTLLAAGRMIHSVPMDTLLENPGSASAVIELRPGSAVSLLPASRALLRSVPESVDLRTGGVQARTRQGGMEVRVETRNGIFSVRGAEFSVELVPRPVQGGGSMESLLALLVSALVGNVQVDAAGKILSVPAGESRAVGVDGTVANTVAELLAAQDDKEKKDDEEKGKEKKGKKKDKKEGKDKDKDKDEKEDDDKKDEKGGKEKEKGKKDD